MSDAETTAPKKKGKAKKLLLIGVGLAVLAGGGAGAAVFAGLIGPAHGPAAPDLPKLVLRKGVSEAEASAYFSPTGDKRPDASKFVASYHPLGEHFTSNLQGGTGMVQLSLGVSTFYDERVLEAVKTHEMAIRSAVLLALSEQDAIALSTPQGKEQLKIKLRGAVNDVLKRREGFGGIDDVYFTSLVLQ
jgi:flagellar FliL protein